MGIFAITLIICAASFAMAGVPDVNNCTATTAYPGGPVVIEVVQGGWVDFSFDQAVVKADPLAPARVVVDATVTVTVHDGAATPPGGNPIVNYPRQDVWLVNTGNAGEPGLVPCVGGNIADLETDAAGQTEFRLPISGGGYSTGLSTVIINGDAVAGSMDIGFNSPDSNGDLLTNGIDLQAFSAAYFNAVYDYTIDLYHTGTENGADLQNFAAHYGKLCD